MRDSTSTERATDVAPEVDDALAEVVDAKLTRLAGFGIQVGMRLSFAIVVLGALTGCVAQTTEPSTTANAASTATGATEPPATVGAATADSGASTAGLALSVHTTLGIPEAATASDPAHALAVKPQYVTSFDSTRKNPRWTSWEVTSKWLGSTGRTSQFVKDTDLSFPQATNADYTGSGYQRGHICPSGDRTNTVADNAATFVFTNAVPQTAASNTGTWETLESDTRSFAKAGSHVFVVAGSIYADTRTIGNGVAVPTSMFKIVVLMSGDHPLPSEVTRSTRVISIEIPNTTTVSGSYKGYRVKFGDLETKTGFRFLSDVAPAVHDALAQVVDAG